MSSDTVISVENLSKKYVLGTGKGGAPGDGLRHALQRLIMAPFQKLPNAKLASNPATSTQEEFYALRNVSFDVKRGEVLGIIGTNGAGKSTLLKILSRITEPTSGRIGIKGRIASLLEVGTGFHPELTGRENISLSGAILGMTAKEVSAKFDEIVDFAGVEKFLDTSVKHYSSGMYVRLAFAVAAHLEPEILIVDEVLAVGDVEFQKKCLGKLQDVTRSSGRTVLFVSHSETAIRNLCGSAIMLNKGSLHAKGEVSTVLGSYRDFTRLRNNTLARTAPPNTKAFVSSLRLLIHGLETDCIFPVANIVIELEVNIAERLEFACEFLLKDANGHPVSFAAPGFTEGTLHVLETGIHMLTYEISMPDLADGYYTFDAMLSRPSQSFYDYWSDATRFRCDSPIRGRSGWKFSHGRGQGAIMLACRHTKTCLQ